MTHHSNTSVRDHMKWAGLLGCEAVLSSMALMQANSIPGQKKMMSPLGQGQRDSPESHQTHHSHMGQPSNGSCPPLETSATKKPRAKRSPAFTQDEMTILLEEVLQHRATLFGGTKGKMDILSKNRIWQDIAKCMAPSSPCGLRDWQGVRKKWQEFASQTKRKAASVRRESQGTGGGALGDTTLTPDEEKVLIIIGKTACEGIDGGTDVLGDEGLSEPGPSLTEDEDEPSGSGTRAAPPTSLVPSNGSLPARDVTPPLPLPRRQPAPAGRPGVRMWGGIRRPSLTRCSCSEALVASEKEKLVVLREIAGHLKRSTAIQQEMVELKREKLELQRRQLALAEAQSIRPSISNR